MEGNGRWRLFGGDKLWVVPSSISGAAVGFGYNNFETPGSIPATIGDVAALYGREFQEFVSRAEALAASMGCRFDGVSWGDGNIGAAKLMFSMWTEKPVQKMDYGVFPPALYWSIEKEKTAMLEIVGRPGFMNIGGISGDLSRLLDPANQSFAMRADEFFSDAAWLRELDEVMVLANRVMVCGALLDYSATDGRFADRYARDQKGAICELAGNAYMPRTWIWNGEGTWNHAFGVERPTVVKETNTPSFAYDLLPITTQAWSAYTAANAISVMPKINGM
jgi:hypothetical protein